jgi:hypothetical protein
MKRPLRLAAIAAITAATVAPIFAQSPPPPCSALQYRQFDFWLGRWDVLAPDGGRAGTNVIEADLNRCALIERWTGRDGFVGMSLNSYSRATNQWHQHWIDSQGGLLRLAGGLKGTAMVLEGTNPHPERPGVTVTQRITWTPAADGSVRQLWERSLDGGATWSVAFDGRYVRQRE